MPYSSDFSPDALEPRITVHEGAQIIEVRFTGLDFQSSADVNAFYDYLETRMDETGEAKWFFLINTENYRVQSEAWFAFTRRGLDLNEGHSMTTLRYDASPETVQQIAKTKGTDREVSNLLGSRDEAWARLKSLPSQRRERITHQPSFDQAEFLKRLQFDNDTAILDVDLSGMDIAHSRDVNDVFNWIEETIRTTKHKWWVMFNYDGTRIQSPAWVQFSLRSDTFDQTYAMGSVRYAVGTETETNKRLRYEAKSSRPNIRPARDAALVRLEELRAQYAASH